MRSIKEEALNQMIVMGEAALRYVLRKVGAGRTAELCFPTPPSEPDVPLSRHPALQGVATSAAGVTTGLVMFFAFTAASIILRDH